MIGSVQISSFEGSLIVISAVGQTVSLHSICIVQRDAVSSLLYRPMDFGPWFGLSLTEEARRARWSADAVWPRSGQKG